MPGSRGKVSRCSNCRRRTGLLYIHESGVVHCGCFYEAEPSQTRHHVSDPVPPVCFDEPIGVW